MTKSVIKAVMPAQAGIQNVLNPAMEGLGSLSRFTCDLKGDDEIVIATHSPGPQGQKRIDDALHRTKRRESGAMK